MSLKPILPIAALKHEGIISGIGDQRFSPSSPITREHFAILMNHVQNGDLIHLFTGTPRDLNVLKRRELSRTLYRLLQIKLGIERAQQVNSTPARV